MWVNFKKLNTTKLGLKSLLVKFSPQNLTHQTDRIVSLINCVTEQKCDKRPISKTFLCSNTFSHFVNGVFLYDKVSKVKDLHKETRQSRVNMT